MVTVAAITLLLVIWFVTRIKAPTKLKKKTTIFLNLLGKSNDYRKEISSTVKTRSKHDAFLFISSEELIFLTVDRRQRKQSQSFQTI